jgi:hypothetical protein
VKEFDNVLFQALAVWTVASAAMTVAKDNCIVANLMENEVDKCSIML